MSFPYRRVILNVQDDEFDFIKLVCILIDCNYIL
jgi:hypothetical protein